MRIASIVLAVLCLMALLPWTLGVPGVGGTSYARGWSVGLASLVLLPAGVAALGLARLVLDLWPRTRHLRVPPALDGALVAAFLAAQAVAWSLILRG